MRAEIETLLKVKELDPPGEGAACMLVSLNSADEMNTCAEYSAIQAYLISAYPELADEINAVYNEIIGDEMNHATKFKTLFARIGEYTEPRD